MWFYRAVFSRYIKKVCYLLEHHRNTFWLSSKKNEAIFPCSALVLFFFFFFTDFKLETLGASTQVPRLASSLSACAQLNTLSAGQRTWALHRLRKLIMSEVGPAIDLPGLFGVNLVYEQPLHKPKQLGVQRMGTVCIQ